MITLTARINLFDNDKSITSGTINLDKTNVSNDFNKILNTRQQGSNPLMFGCTTFNTNPTFENKVPYYIGNAVADEDGWFPTNENTEEPGYIITIQGNLIKSLIIHFDTYNNQHPTTMNIDGDFYDVTNSTFNTTLADANNHTLLIENWNTPNYPLRIEGICVDIQIDINNNNLISLNRIINDRSDIDKPSWGIIANTGDIKFNDLNNFIKKYIQEQLLKSNMIVHFEIKNNLVADKKELIGKYLTEKWDYDNFNKIVSVSLKDDLLNWQNIQLSKMPLQNQMNMLQIYNYLVAKTTPYDFFFEELDNDTEEMLLNTVCVYPYLESGSLWNAWQKLCEVCALYIYKNNKDNVVVSYEFRSN